MLLGWFDTSAATDFATTIAREIQESMPVTDESPSKKEVGKRARRIERITDRAREFSRTHRLNFYKKAKLVNTLKWSLKEAGYSELFVREMAGLIMVNL